MLDKAEEYYGANLHPVELWITNVGDRESFDLFNYIETNH